MDFDIGNILYIVITLVAVIIGLLGKKKKSAGDTPGATKSESRPGFLENLERVLQMGQEGTVVKGLQEDEEDLLVEEEVHEEVISEPTPTPGIMAGNERIMNAPRDEDGNLIPGEGEAMAEALEVIDLDDETATNYFEIVKDFDAGTAIVYSTIINRLDY